MTTEGINRLPTADAAGFSIDKDATAISPHRLYASSAGPDQQPPDKLSKELWTI